MGRYKKLREVIRQNLSDVKVFTLGQRKVVVYIVCKTDEGDWAGLKTTAVETQRKRLVADRHQERCSIPRRSTNSSVELGFARSALR